MLVDARSIIRTDLPTELLRLITCKQFRNAHYSPVGNVTLGCTPSHSPGRRNITQFVNGPN